MKTDFDRYVTWKRAQHARAMQWAREARSNPERHATLLAQAAAVRRVLRSDLTEQRRGR